MALPNYNPNLSSPVGSGNPYWGSGFTNFDRFLQDPNVQWGAEQTDYFSQPDNYDEGVAISNWLIDASGKAGFPKPTGPAQESPDETPDAPEREVYDPQINREWTNLDAHVDRAHENNPWYDPETGNYYGGGGRGGGRGNRWDDSGYGAGYRDW